MEKYYKEQRGIIRKFVDEVIEKLINEKIDLSNKEYLISLLEIEIERMLLILSE